jgi:hypothetical protein
MVARIDNELLAPALLTPRPDLSDSDDVLLAVETARALEAQGEFREAVRWLRRAADEAEQQGNDERVLVFARAAADMSNFIGTSPPGAETPTLPPRASDVVEAGEGPYPPTLDAGDAQYPPTTPPPESLEATIPPPASPAPPLPLPFPAPATVSSPPDTPFAERSMRIGAIRVAILEASIRGAKSFFVERLEKGQLPPAGSTEAMLVFTGEAEGEAEQNVDLLAASDSIIP